MDLTHTNVAAAERKRRRRLRLVPRRPHLSSSSAVSLHRAMSRALNRVDWRLVLWDGRTAGSDRPTFTIALRSHAAVDRLLSGVPEKAFGRAYVEGLIDVAPLEPFLEPLAAAPIAHLFRAWPAIATALLGLGGRPHGAPILEAEARLRGIRHSRQRDAEAISHHYDLPPEFYALFLDRSLTYSCGYFESAEAGLDAAQESKLELVCRKLRLQPGETLLDVGCGYGSLVIHAAQHHGVRAVGITLSRAQVDCAHSLIRERGLEDRVEVRLADYRDDNGTYDAVASIGMVEHVGRKNLGVYSQAVHRSLRPGGRALIHGITQQPSRMWNRASFNDAFVFPDGEIEDVGLMIRAYERAGLEVRDVESLREHYEMTLRLWARRLDANWEEAVRIAGEARALVWRLYLIGAAVSFRLGTLAIHQTLAVRPDPQGLSNLPLTRRDWYA
ncbi:MAG: class I SAM-dependent methyltransferase [Candidatus Dormibacteraeota bacterium]|uniref:Class I SAM-dependent methyltransferase n=1 Tax=Candidatus Amunia macphersoniae TaxID=3127014 RepID=A0A934NFF3_9BACT|nr:class I SAM-dependent methyltransferase [Candidatus Dormibacteraeota bacterium]